MTVDGPKWKMVDIFGQDRWRSLPKEMTIVASLCSGPLRAPLSLSLVR